MIRHLAVITFLLVIPSLSFAADKYTVKVDDTPPPKELAEPVRALLSGKAMTVVDEKGQAALHRLAGEVTRIEGDRRAGEGRAQVLAGRRDHGRRRGEVPRSLDRLPQAEDQAGRLHAAPRACSRWTATTWAPPRTTSSSSSARPTRTRSPTCSKSRRLHELSAKSVGRKHPGMMLLFPNKTPADAPVVEAKPNDHYLLSYRVPVTAGGEKSFLGFSLVVVGVTMAE